jgi:hypothetical protein
MFRVRVLASATTPSSPIRVIMGTAIEPRCELCIRVFTLQKEGEGGTNSGVSGAKVKKGAYEIALFRCLSPRAAGPMQAQARTEAPGTLNSAMLLTSQQGGCGRHSEGHAPSERRCA